MDRFKKMTAALILSTAILASSITVGFASQIVYERVEEEIISSGVSHKNIVRFGRDGWLNMNVAYIDLEDNNIELDVLTSSKGLSTKETLSTMAKNNKNVVSAINGDFFYMLNPDSPLGTIIKDGEVISSPITVHDYASFFIDNNKKAFIDYLRPDTWKDQLYATTDKGVTIPISTINKYTDQYQYIMLIDRNWGTHSPGYNESLEDMVEVVVENNIVVEIRQKQPAVEIPEEGYILLAAKGKSPWAQAEILLSSLNIGDEISINKKILPNLEDIKLAFGGGSVLVKDGQPATFTQNVSGAHPRTAIGISQDGSKLIFITVDGRHTYYKGLDGKQLAQILISLGSYNALMLDGGGSTTMVKRGLGEFEPKIINHPSDGSERRIINGIAAISKSTDRSLQGIKLELDDDKSFVGVSRQINVKAFDQNYNPLLLDTSKVNLSLKEGQGYFDGMEFIATGPGQVVIEAEYSGAVASIGLEVLQDLSHMEINPGKLILNFGEATGFSIKGFDTEGYTAKINAKDLDWKDVNGLGSFSKGIYVAGDKSGRTRLEGSLGSSKIIIDTAIGRDYSYDKLEGAKSTRLEDRLKRPYEIEGEKLFVHSGVSFKEYTLLDKIVANKISSLVNDSYISLFTGNIDPRLGDRIKNQTLVAKSGYSYIEDKNNLFIQLDNTIDGIRQTNFDQWPWLEKLINTKDKKNIFIVMAKPIFGEGGFSDRLEADLLMEKLTQLYEEGKQVFVVYQGKKPGVDLINGVRYISTGNYNSENIKNPQEAFKYIEFNINDQEVTYQIKSLFQ